ncbi:MAG: DUF1631 family protein, partial [Casimicrobiaceae bacterium]
MAKALSDCRDLAIHRLQLSFSAMFDRISDLLMDRASKSDIRSEQSLFLDARGALKTERASLMTEFEKGLRKRVDDRIAGREERLEFSTSDVDPTKLTLVDTTAMDESVLTGNITRIVENACHDELNEFNRCVGYLLGKPGLETDSNPLAPEIIVAAFADALKEIKADKAIKFQILKELNQASLGDLAAIYADMNRHLVNLRIIPASTARGKIVNRGSPTDRTRPPVTAANAPAAPASTEVDMMSLFKRMYGGGAAASMAPPGRNAPGQQPPPAMASSQPPMEGDGGGFPSIDPGMMLAQAAAAAAAAPGGQTAFAPMPTTASGYVPGAPIMATQSLHEGLTRLQAGQVNFDVDGATVAFAGIPQGLHN